jgi:serine 3-dehydrogenase
MNLSGKNVLITGASSGIGAACAEGLANLGCRLVLVARRRDRLEELKADLENRHSVEILIDVLDIRDRRAVEDWVANLPDGWSEIDILLNNAGLARGLAPLHEGQVEDWEEMIDTNLKGLLYVTRAVLPGMVARGRGHLINIGSIAGHEVYPAGNVYCASKHAVAALNRALGIDTLGTGVRASSVDPGLVETEFALVRFHGDSERAKSVYDGIEALRAADVAEAVVFCATRPAHANVREMILMPTAQATTAHVHRTS